MLRCRFGCKITQRIISQISESSRNLGFLRGFFLVILLISIWQKDSSNPFYYSEHQHVRKSVFFNRNKTWIILRFFRKMEIKIFVFLFTIFLFASTEATKREGHCKCHLGTKTKMMVNYLLWKSLQVWLHTILPYDRATKHWIWWCHQFPMQM